MGQSDGGPPLPLVGPTFCAARMGCHSPSPTVPSSLFASFPFLTEKEARGCPRKSNYRRKWVGETPGKPQADGQRAGGGMGMQRSEKRVLRSLLQLLPSDGVAGDGRQRHRSTAQANQCTASQAEGWVGKPRSFVLTPGLSFHLENGIFKK